MATVVCTVRDKSMCMLNIDKKEFVLCIKNYQQIIIIIMCTYKIYL